MTLDLGRALRDAVDSTGPDTSGGLVPGTLLARVRRRRAVRTGSRAVVGAGAVCAVGAGAALGTGWLRTPTPAGAGPTPTATAESTSPTELCGERVDELATGPQEATVSVGIAGVADLGAFTGRTLGPRVPVWLTVPADEGRAASTVAPVGAALVLAQDGVVVAVVDGGAALVSARAVTDDAAAVLTPDSGLVGTGDLVACPGSGSADGTGEPAAGAYSVHAVADLDPVGDGSAQRAVSDAVPLTLLPVSAPLTTDDGVPADIPLDQVPLIGGTLLRERDVLGGGWEVTIAVTGDDALLRVATSLGVPAAGTFLVEELLDATGSDDPEVSARVRAAIEGASLRPYDLGGAQWATSATVHGATSFSADAEHLTVAGDELSVDVLVTATEGGAEVRYRIYPQD